MEYCEMKIGGIYYDRRSQSNVQLVAPHPDDGACLIVIVLKDEDIIDDIRFTERSCLSEEKK